MPKGSYLLLHPEARVTKLEVEQFCVWSKGEITQLVRKKQQQSRSRQAKLLQTGSN